MRMKASMGVLFHLLCKWINYWFTCQSSREDWLPRKSTQDRAKVHNSLALKTLKWKTGFKKRDVLGQWRNLQEALEGSMPPESCMIAHKANRVNKPASLFDSLGFLSIYLHSAFPKGVKPAWKLPNKGWEDLLKDFQDCELKIFLTTYILNITHCQAFWQQESCKDH